MHRNYERNKSLSFTYATMVGMVLQAVCEETYASVIVEAGDGTITLQADNTDGETTTVLDCDPATYTTMGAMVDAINGTAQFRARLVGLDRAVLSADMMATLSVTHLKTGGTAANRANGISLYVDPAGDVFTIGFAVTNEKFISQPSGGFSTKDVGWVKNGGGIVNYLNWMTLNLTTIGDGVLSIMGCDDRNKVAGVAIHSEAYVTATAESHGTTTPIEKHWAVPEGQRMLVQFIGAAAHSAGTIVGLGTTKTYTGTYVPGGNYIGCA